MFVVWLMLFLGIAGCAIGFVVADTLDAWEE